MVKKESKSQVTRTGRKRGLYLPRTVDTCIKKRESFILKLLKLGQGVGGEGTSYGVHVIIVTDSIQ